MSLRILTWLYRKLGSFYPAAFMTVELQSAFVVTAATVALISLYYDASTDEFFQALAVALALTAFAVGYTMVRTYRRLRPVQRWIAGARGAGDTARAWSAAVGLPLDLLRRDLPWALALTVIPACAAAVALLSLPWTSFFPFLIGAAVAVGYATILHYLAIEAGMRPVLVDLNREVTPRESKPETLPLRVRLMAALPLINIITGLVVVALTSDGGEAAQIGVDVLVAVAVAAMISLELTILLSKSILRPIADLQRATEAVREGRYDVTVPVISGDELGELAASFNQMLAGLRERERLRKAFGTYLDKEVAEYILSERFVEEGIEREVSILFCDVENFTRFAANATATEVVARLNELFETVVPVVARHGGHVDKFEGDGLLAVFGAPEPFEDHADRAVRAAIEMAARVNHRDGERFRIGVGVNTGRVVAGSIGGAGRLNFSVIGDPVNVAARTEHATRRTGDDVLITAATAERLRDPIPLEERPGIVLKGLDEPMTLYAPEVPEVAALAPGDGHAETIGARFPGELGARPDRTTTLPGM